MSEHSADTVRMQWNARGMGLEGRVDWEMALVADPWREPPRPPFEVKVPHQQRMSVWELDPAATVPYDVIVYRFEQEADDGTLIYRRVTPALTDGVDDAS
jgi:hypothetical protein